MSPLDFVAIDFETADYGADSACAVGLVKVSEGVIVRQEHFFIRPPRRDFRFTYIHGIEWAHVAKKPAFKELWPLIEELFAGARFLAAHNAPFDRGVLNACCAAAGLTPPPQPFLCTVRLARKTWNLKPARLPNVCDYLGIDLNHHEALSDASACARIVLAAAKTGALVAP
jgi:DNA polymerase-3 subunit epsilon